MSTSNWQVLIIEDEPDNMELVQGILEYNGIRTIPVMTGEEALEVLQGTTPTLILIDLALPGIDGWGLLDYLQENERLSGIPRVAMTVYHTASLAHKAVEAGFDAYIPKPIDAASLVSDLESIVNSK